MIVLEKEVEHLGRPVFKTNVCAVCGEETGWGRGIRELQAHFEIYHEEVYAMVCLTGEFSVEWPNPQTYKYNGDEYWGSWIQV